MAPVLLRTLYIISSDLKQRLHSYNAQLYAVKNINRDGNAIG